MTIREADYPWEDIHRIGQYQREFIKRFKIDFLLPTSLAIFNPDSVGEPIKILKKVIDGSGFSGLLIVSRFEIEYNNKRYILSTGIEDDAPMHDDNMVPKVRFVLSGLGGEKFVDDIIKEFDISPENALTLKIYFFGDDSAIEDLLAEEECIKESPNKTEKLVSMLDSKGRKAYNVLESLIKEIEVAAQEVIFGRLREYVLQEVQSQEQPKFNVEWE